MSLLTAVVEAADDAILTTSAGFTILTWNPGAHRLYGWTEDEVVGRQLTILFAPERVQDFSDARSRLRRDGHARFETVNVRKDGSRFEVSTTLSNVYDDAGDVAAIVGITRDITERKHAERRLRESEQRLAEAQRLAQVGSWEWDVAADEVTWSQELFRMFGVEPDRFDATSSGYIAYVHPDDRALVRDRFESALRTGASFDFEHRIAGGAEATTWVRCRGEVMRDAGGAPVRLRGTAQDITAARRAEQALREQAELLERQARQLTRMAFHDPLTGLANRMLLNDRLTHALTPRRRRPVTLLLLDLDEFKAVNDVSGHAAGDKVLVEVARRLRSCVRPSDTVARFGGDEFAVILEDAGDAVEVAERILQALRTPVDIGERRVVPHASIGIAGNERGGRNAEDLLRRADVAMYAAKAGGKARYEVFRPELEAALVARANLEAALRRALERNELVVHYQPIVAAEAGTVVGVEALVRWQRGSGLVPPADFLPLAEETGLIVDIGRAVLERSCERLSRWLRESSGRSMAVNVSALQLRQPDFGDDVLHVLRAAGVDPGQLVLEVTETLFLDSDATILDQLVLLRNEGVQVCIDDFGTGYSSLGRLQVLPVDSMKIDSSFVRLIRTGTEDLPILTSMIVMAHSLGLEVTAEGVETRDQPERLIALGCDYLQGYYFARPEGAATDAALTRATQAALRNLQDVTSPQGRPLVVLVVDDDPVVRHLVKASLAGPRFEVEEAASGAEALALVPEARPDCLLVDLGLPDMDGLELVVAARRDLGLTRSAIVVLTGAAEREAKLAAFRAGADDYIVKPVLPQHLAARVRGAIRAARTAPRTAPA